MGGADGRDVKAKILGTVSDLVADLMYYDRKEDEELPPGRIEKAIVYQHITVDDIVDQFRQDLLEALASS